MRREPTSGIIRRHKGEISKEKLLLAITKAWLEKKEMIKDAKYSGNKFNPGDNG